MSRESQAAISPSALLEQRVRAVFRHLPGGLAGDEAAIHQMRVAGRRLREALPLLARKPRGRRVKRALRMLRRLARAAGPSRDFDVSLDLFDGHLLSQGATPERVKLRRHLRAARAYSHRRTADAFMDLEIARLRRDLRVVLARRAEDVFSVRARLRDARDKHGPALARGFAALGSRFDPEELHALRRRARRLRYTAEIGDAHRAGSSSEAAALWKSLQERLGRLHDHQVLSAWLESHAAVAARRGERLLAAEARAQQAWATATAEGLHRELIAARPLDVTARALEAMGGARTEACAS